MENTVENNVQAAMDDALVKPEDSAANLDSLESLANAEPAPTAEAEPPAKEPGWIRQRVDKAVEKALAKARQDWEAEQETKLAPIYESMYDRQAEALVREGEFKSLERAKEYVRLKGGVIEAPKQPEPKQRDNSGRFVKQEAPAEDPQAKFLFQQAKKIQKNSGLDVLGAFQNDEEVRAKVGSGEWDFYDVADYMRQQNGRHTPVPVRSPNGAKPSAFSIASMSDEQFAQLQRNLSNGKRYDARK